MGNVPPNTINELREELDQVREELDQMRGEIDVLNARRLPAPRRSRSPDPTGRLSMKSTHTINTTPASPLR